MKTLTSFVDDCCIIASNARYPALELYLTYVNWCLNRGCAVHDQFSFLEEMEGQGFAYFQKPRASFFEGITVQPNYRVE